MRETTERSLRRIGTDRRAAVLNLLGLGLAAGGLLAVAVLADTKPLLLVAVLYLAVGLLALTPGARRDVLLFNTSFTLGVAAPGLVTYTVALLPGVAVLVVGCITSERRSRPLAEVMLVLAGFSIGLWLVIAVVLASRAA